MNKKTKLVLPHKKYLKSWQNFIKDFIKNLPENNPDKSGYEKQLVTSKKPEYFKWLQDDHLGRNLGKEKVPQSTYWGIINDQVIGRISFRPILNKRLREFGGNIGYAVRPKFQGKGYATEMLTILLGKIRRAGTHKRVLLTCDADNIGSRKVIEANGGKLQKQGSANGTESCWYWIKL